MKLTIGKEKGWSEVVIDSHGGYDRFYETAAFMQSALRIIFINRLNDLDSLYWDFEYEGSLLTLHYNIYLGVLLFPTQLGEAGAADNDKAEELGEKFARFLEQDSRDWKEFDKGRTIGKTGHEGGTIISDTENVHGARITVEELRGPDAPFVITFGIYGLLFHTHAKPTLEMAREYMTGLKYKMNKVFDMYELPEKSRSDEWYHEHDRLVHELTID